MIKYEALENGIVCKDNGQDSWVEVCTASRLTAKEALKFAGVLQLCAADTRLNWQLRRELESQTNIRQVMSI